MGAPPAWAYHTSCVGSLEAHHFDHVVLEKVVTAPLRVRSMWNVGKIVERDVVAISRHRRCRIVGAGNTRHVRDVVASQRRITYGPYIHE